MLPLRRVSNIPLIYGPHVPVDEAVPPSVVGILEGSISRPQIDGVSPRELLDRPPLPDAVLLVGGRALVVDSRVGDSVVRPLEVALIDDELHLSLGEGLVGSQPEDGHASLRPDVLEVQGEGVDNEGRLALALSPSLTSPVPRPVLPLTVLSYNVYGFQEDFLLVALSGC